MSSNFLLPLKIQHTSNAILYGESTSNLISNYVFEDVSGVITTTQMRNTFKYKDSDSGTGPFMKYDENGINVDTWHNLITNQILISLDKYRNSNVQPSNSKLAGHIIQWIASTLFGHPLAQAPITNEDSIITDISDGSVQNTKLGQQLYDAFSGDSASGTNGTQDNIILRTMYEQMVTTGRFNTGSGEGTDNNALPDTEGFVSLPFKNGDKVSFLLDIGCNLSADSSIPDTSGLPGTSSGTTYSSLATSFYNGINGVKSDGSGLNNEVWKFTFVMND